MASHNMKAAFILRNLSEPVIADIAGMDDRERFEKLLRWASGDLKHCVSMQFGSGNAFRDRVDFLFALKSGKPFRICSMERGTGSWLASFGV